MPAPAWGELVFDDEAHRSTLSRAVASGTLRRIGTGIYTGIRTGSVEPIVRRHWLTILGHELPGAILADRSARRTLLPQDGNVYVVHGRARKLELPGLTIVPRKGPGPLPGDIALPSGVVLSSQARGLLDNISGRTERVMSLPEVERWVADILTEGGEQRLNTVRDAAREIAETTRQQPAFERLDRMIAAALTTGPADGLKSDVPKAWARGQAHDTRRVDAFAALAETLRSVAPSPLPALPVDAARRRLLPFYEAYFSNYIEGTEFTLDEAAAIAFDGQVPMDRPADAHDVLGTYELVADEREMSRTAPDADSFISLVQGRHAAILAGRPEMRPGKFKLRPNQAGATLFVAPDMVEGTLRAGFQIASDVLDPFARAVFMMFLVSEVHPFADGNGRIARVMMNSELVAGGQVRMIIPIVYRNDYLAALKGATHNRGFAGLTATLRFAQAYTARVDFSSRRSAEEDLARTNALRDPAEAEAAGVRLTLP